MEFFINSVVDHIYYKAQHTAYKEADDFTCSRACRYIYKYKLENADHSQEQAEDSKTFIIIHEACHDAYDSHDKKDDGYYNSISIECVQACNNKQQIFKPYIEIPADRVSIQKLFGINSKDS